VHIYANLYFASATFKLVFSPSVSLSIYYFALLLFAVIFSYLFWYFFGHWSLIIVLPVNTTYVKHVYFIKRRALSFCCSICASTSILWLRCLIVSQMLWALPTAELTWQRGQLGSKCSICSWFGLASMLGLQLTPKLWPQKRTHFNVNPQWDARAFKFVWLQ